MKNRKLKFRVWNRKKEEMLKPFHLLQYMDASERYQQEMCDAYGEDVVLMQYTGLKDKNGVEIYEGDVVKYVVNPHYEFENGKRTGVVKFEDGRFTPLPGHTHSDDLSDFENDKFEVIGNIYENPNLLKEPNQ